MVGTGRELEREFGVKSPLESFDTGANIPRKNVKHHMKIGQLK